MATAGKVLGGVELAGGVVSQWISAVGDLAIFAGKTFLWMFRGRLARGTLLTNCYYVGVRSVPVVTITGMFIGMVLAVQSYRDFNRMGLASRLGAIINISVVRELGPVLAATMIAGRVGSAMAAELGSMRITEQIEALICLGANPFKFLVVPRFLACVLLIPLLTVIADVMGIWGGAFICLHVFQVEPHYYWMHSREYVRMWDIFNGLGKSMFFGAAIALISCHRGLNCKPGAEGVGRAATEAFVMSFIAILGLDFVLAMLSNNLSTFFWPVKVRSII